MRTPKGCHVLSSCLTLVTLVTVSCAVGPRGSSPEGPPAASLAGIDALSVACRDRGLEGEVIGRLDKVRGPKVAPAAAGTPVLVVDINCGTELGFMPLMPMHTACNGLDPDDVMGRGVAPESAANNCLASITLSLDGVSLWWDRNQARVTSQDDAASLARRMVDRFLKDWKRANP